MAVSAAAMSGIGICRSPSLTDLMRFGRVPQEEACLWCGAPSVFYECAPRPNASAALIYGGAAIGEVADGTGEVGWGAVP
jgi:hypothetical protein